MGYVVPRVNRLKTLTHSEISVSDKSILDYGSNRGNLLEDGIETGDILPENYTGMDVDLESLEYLKEHSPTATTIHYDRYNPVYNTEGQRLLKFPFSDNTFDIVYSFSVNTHSSWEDYVFDISEMVRVSRGVVYSSILDLSVLKILHDKRIDEYGSAVDFEVFRKVDTGVYFIDNDTVLELDQEIPHNTDYLLTYYNPEWLIEEINKLGYSARVLDSHSPQIQPLLEIKDN